MSNLEIRRMQADDCPAVAQLHLQYLITNFSGAAGAGLLKHYYRAVCLERGAAGYAGLIDGQLAGYVCGVWDPGEVRSVMLRTQWVGLLGWGTLQVLTKPGLIRQLAGRVDSEPEEISQRQETGYELRPIVVDSKARGSGLAYQLTMRLLSDARTRGFAHIHLFTEIENIPAQRFYQKSGFNQTGTIVRNGQTYLRYEIKVKPA